MYFFEEQLVIGELGANFLDTFFSKWYYIEKVSKELELLGIDRIFTLKNNQSKTVNKRLSVEYKTDMITSSTGNFFIETKSVVKNKKIVKFGWAYTSIAQKIFYFVPKDAKIYILDLNCLRNTMKINNWLVLFKEKECFNKDYSSHGLLVPTDTIVSTSNTIVLSVDTKLIDHIFNVKA